MRRAPARVSRATHVVPQHTRPRPPPTRPLAASVHVDSRLLSRQLSQRPIVAPPLRHFASRSDGQAPGDRDAEPETRVTPWTRFIALPYKPKRVGLIFRWKRWWNALSKFNINEEDFLAGAKQAFLTISPFLIYGSPMPPVTELRSMLEPDLVRVVRRAHKEQMAMQPGLVELVSANVITIDLHIDEPVRRRDDGKVEKLSARLEDLRRLLSVVVCFHTKEEVKSFSGIQQLSPTRFFDMEHMWVFVRRLPSHNQVMESRKKGEEEPNAPWMLARSICFYPAHLQVDVRKEKKDEDDEDD